MTVDCYDGDNLVHTYGPSDDFRLVAGALLEGGVTRLLFDRDSGDFWIDIQYETLQYTEIVFNP